MPYVQTFPRVRFAFYLGQSHIKSNSYLNQVTKYDFQLVQLLVIELFRVQNPVFSEMGTIHVFNNLQTILTLSVRV